ncbi:MAG: hypothetical protein ACLUFN_04095 [Eubacterium sp.]
MTEKVYIESPNFTGRNVPVTEIQRQSEKMHSMFVSDFKRVF